MSNDNELMRYIRGLMDSSQDTFNTTNHSLDAKLLWSGKHYLLTRSGLYQGVREAEIWSREGLLLRRGNREKNAMMELALATIHPVNRRWSKNLRRTVHRSGGRGGITPQFENRRWSKSCLRDAIAFCEQEDALFEQRQAEEIERRRQADEFCRKSVDKFSKAGARARRLERIPTDPGEQPAGYTYRVALQNESKSKDNFSFIVKFADRVEVTWRGGHLSYEEFEILRDALIEIHNNRLEEDNETADN